MAVRPLLSWKLGDYKKNNIEPPEELIKSPERTEGELMSDTEVQIWFQDCYKTLLALKDEDKELYEDLRNVFIRDIQHLIEVEKISEDALDELLEDDLLN